MFQANDSTTKVKQDGGEYDVFAQIRHAILTSELKLPHFLLKLLLFLSLPPTNAYAN